MSSFREKYHQECRENGQAMNGRRCQLQIPEEPQFCQFDAQSGRNV